jgi:multidrug efflux system outer membrane protein
VADGLAARGTYTDHLAALRRNADDQQRRLELANLRFTNGVDSYLNVLTAQTDLYNAQITLVSTRLGQLTSLVDLYRALGGGWLERSASTSAPGPRRRAGGAARNDHPRTGGSVR